MSSPTSITDNEDRARLELRVDGKTVIATCPFALSYIARHSELDEFLVPSARRRSPD